MSSLFFIHPDICVAETLPASFYRDQDLFEQLKEKIFVKSWHWIGEDHLLPLESYAHPFILLEHYLDEPMLLVRDRDGKIHCLSNVCTHRGNLVVRNPGKMRQLLCGYHGRRFDLNGQFKMMPEFKEAHDFPRSCDHLPSFPIEKWGPFLFTSLDPGFDFSSVLSKVQERISFLPLNEFRFDPSNSKDYLVNCHWALYCDNYLEGFHIPFVHE